MSVAVGVAVGVTIGAHGPVMVRTVEGAVTVRVRCAVSVSTTLPLANVVVIGAERPSRGLTRYVSVIGRLSVIGAAKDHRSRPVSGS